MERESEQLKNIVQKIRGRLIHHGIFARNNSKSFMRNDGEQFRVMVVEDAFAGVQKMDQRDNLARACCGKSFANMVFTVFKSRIALVALFGIWAAGAALNFLGVVGTISPAFALVGMLMTLPKLMVDYALMSKQVAQRLFWEWETWLLIMLVGASAIAYCDVLVRDPVRAIGFAATLTVNMGVLIFNDAQLQISGSSRLFMSVGYLLGLAWIFSIMLTFQLGAAKDLHIRKIRLSPAGIEISEIDVLFFANRRLLTISFFVIKNIYMKLRFPKAFAVLRARVLSVKTTKAEAQRALDGMMRTRSKRLSVMDKFAPQKSRSHVGIRRITGRLN